MHPVYGRLVAGTHPQYGWGFFDSIGNFFKKAFGFVKDNKLLSKAGNIAGSILPFIPGANMAAGPLNMATKIAEQNGFGHKHHRRNMRGSGAMIKI